MQNHEHDPLRPHAHEPNPEPPHDDPTITVVAPHGETFLVTPEMLRQWPATTAHHCFIVSTGHGTSGPFDFTGVTLPDLCSALGIAAPIWREAEIVSADGFGTRITREEAAPNAPIGPVVLAYACNGEPLSRRAGLVRLIVPGERDDALRQVKWVATVRFVSL
ncbi:MAG: hypothetical protein D6802_02310 [Ardenticatenia bacterium]|nr:MAG: hypothetical protein D6802_02310 [Ardenticatenia bacterium]